MLAWRVSPRIPGQRLGVTIFRLPLRACYSHHYDPTLEPDYEKAREWFKDFSSTAPALKAIGEVTYSRSSGPGGQNVNKVNTKARLRIPVDRLLPLIPSVLHPQVLASRHYAANSSSVVIHADESRKQQANKDACYRKLNDLLADAYKHSVPGETTEEQHDKVKKLQKAENEARLKIKKKVSGKKQSRAGKGFEG